MSELIFMIMIALCISTPVLAIVAFVYFIMNLVSLISSTKENKSHPESVPADRISVIKKKMIVSAAIFVVLTVIIVSFVILFAMEIAYM